MAFPADQIRWDIHRRGRKADLIRIDDTEAAPLNLTMRFKPVRSNDVDGNRVLETDQIVHIYAPDVTGRGPEVGDEIKDGAETFSIMAVTKKTRGTSTLRYNLRVRL